MKAFLLAAGKGTRLQPITFHIPKCLVPINKKPLIEYWFDLFEVYGIDEILINTSYLKNQVKSYIDEHSRGLKINLTYEDTLLGSGGTIKNNWDFVKDEEIFYIFYADNLTNINLKELQEFHRKSGRDFTLATCRVPNPHECGIVEVNEDGAIISFAEKPEHPASDLAFAGIMLSSTSLINYFPAEDVFDLGYDVLPRIIGNSSAFVMKDYLIDIGTPDKLKQAENDAKKNLMQIKIT